MTARSQTAALDELGRRCGHAAAAVEHLWHRVQPRARKRVSEWTRAERRVVPQRGGEEVADRRRSARVGAISSVAAPPQGTPGGKPSSLSVCCMTADPSAQVAARTRNVPTRGRRDRGGGRRPHGSGFVTLGVYDGVADRVMRFEFRPPVDRPRAWLASQCAGDWLLSIDGDEVPSGAFVAALPDLVEATDVIQYWLPRRWLYPTEATWLAESPWWPDFQLRLLRNDATLAARSKLHRGFVPALPFTAPRYPSLPPGLCFQRRRLAHSQVRALRGRGAGPNGLRWWPLERRCVPARAVGGPRRAEPFPPTIDR